MLRSGGQIKGNLKGTKKQLTRDILLRGNLFGNLFGIIHVLSKGAFNNYVDRILPFFDSPPPLRGQFFTLSMDKSRHFFTPSPPNLVHVVIEWPIRKATVIKCINTQSMALILTRLCSMAFLCPDRE